jgi:putative membrane protein
VTLAAAVGPHEMWRAWAGDPLVLAGILLACWCYARGVLGIWDQVGRGRVVTRWQARAWTAGILALLVALASPLEALAGTLFSAHMAQHVLLTTVAAPLLVLSRPVLPLLQGLPHRLRQRFARLQERAQALRGLTYATAWPLAAAGLHGAVTWLWHLPGPYQAALRSDVVHATEHVTLVGSAVLLWWAILESGRRSAFGYGTGIAAVFVVALSQGALGAVLTFAPNILYAHYAASTAIWGMAALHDQHVAGVVMWAPGKFVHGLVVVLLAVAWLRAAEERALEREAR